MNGDKRNSFIFVGLLILTLAVVLVNYRQGTVQDAKFDKENKTFQIINTYIEQGKYDTAQVFIRDLLETHPTSDVLLWSNAICLASKGNYTEALEYFDMARKNNFMLVENKDYLQQYAMVLQYTGQYQRAQKYFERAKQIAIKP